MAGSPDNEIKGEIDAALARVAQTLRVLARHTTALSTPNAAVLARTAGRLKRAVKVLRTHSAARSRILLRKAEAEVHEHPIASLAAAITAAAALAEALSRRGGSRR